MWLTLLSQAAFLHLWCFRKYYPQCRGSFIRDIESFPDYYSLFAWISLLSCWPTKSSMMMSNHNLLLFKAEFFIPGKVFFFLCSASSSLSTVCSDARPWIEVLLVCLQAINLQEKKRLLSVPSNLSVWNENQLRKKLECPIEFESAAGIKSVTQPLALVISFSQPSQGRKH